MSNYERILNLFISQHSEYEKSESKLEMNVYCDIMIDHKIIAVSDVPHDLLKMGYILPSKWTILQQLANGK